VRRAPSQAAFPHVASARSREVLGGSRAALTSSLHASCAALRLTRGSGLAACRQIASSLRFVAGFACASACRPRRQEAIAALPRNDSGAPRLGEEAVGGAGVVLVVAGGLDLAVAVGAGAVGVDVEVGVDAGVVGAVAVAVGAGGFDAVELELVGRSTRPGTRACQAPPLPQPVSSTANARAANARAHNGVPAACRALPALEVARRDPDGTVRRAVMRGSQQIDASTGAAATHSPVSGGDHLV
jgi:hypothetical protein